MIRISSNIFSLFFLKDKNKFLHCTDVLSAYIQYQDFRIDLVTGEKQLVNVDEFFVELAKLKISEHFEKPIVVHLMYEFGFSCIDKNELIDPTKPLGIFIQYDKAEVINIEDRWKQNKELVDVKLSPLGLPNFKDYKEKFNKAYQHLLDGQCYQLNLTVPFYLRSETKLLPEDYIQLLWAETSKLGAYAHATYIDSLGKLFLSNTPECLFQISDTKIRTMPIKGTVRINAGDNLEKQWASLANSKKDEAELNMITDLMRNDLTKINLAPSKVSHQKLPLFVPGLVHQFSVIEAPLNKKNSLKDILISLFPGGSITGAPKANVMKLTKEIEKYTRGFYCGSTVLLYKKIKTASINIRSVEVDFIQDEIIYGSGGGITLESDARQEYDEVLAKLKSFLLLLS